MKEYNKSSKLRACCFMISVALFWGLIRMRANGEKILSRSSRKSKILALAPNEVIHDDYECA